MTGFSEPATLGVDHVGLTVADINPTRNFFCECLGWSVIGERPAYPAVFVGDGTTMITIWQAKSEADHVAFDRHQNTGLHHLALKVKDLETLKKTFDKVKGFKGVKVEFAPEPMGAGPKMHFMINEPGGCRLEFNCNPAKPS